MQTTRFTYLAILGVNAALNGLALLQLFAFIDFLDWVVPAALLFNLIFIPVAIPWAYRVGELAEEEFRRKLPAPERSEERMTATETDVAPAATVEGMADKDRPPQ